MIVLPFLVVEGMLRPTPCAKILAYAKKIAMKGNGGAGRRAGRRLRLAHRVAQVGDADPRDHPRVAEDGWRAGKVIEQSHAGSEQQRRDVDVDLVEQFDVQELLDEVRAVDR